jgi:chemotaxis protein methyltransferase CheR
VSSAVRPAGLPVLPEGASRRLAALLARSAGLVVDGTRRAALAADVALRLRATGLELPDYLVLVESRGPDGDAERAALIDEVTIGETSFFRNAPQMTALRDVWLPELLRRAGARGRPLRIWSAGCSTGEEPYTLAMIVHELLEALPRSGRPAVSLLATDVSRPALAAARAGRYRGRAASSAQRAGLASHFLRDGDDWLVRPEIASRVEFAQHNLATDDPPFPPGASVDLVMCRNVTIYFARETTRALVARFATCLRPGGYLVLGHAESLWQLSDDFGLVGHGDAFAYERLPLADPPSPVAAAVVPRPRPVPDAPSELPPPAPPPAPVADGVRLLAAGDAPAALALAAERLAFDPMDALAHCLQGRALADLGRDVDAVPALRAAVYAEPTCGAAHFLLAVVLERLGQSRTSSSTYALAGDVLTRYGDPGGLAGLEGRDVAELAALCRFRAAQGAAP